jgi:hypothetical protein
MVGNSVKGGGQLAASFEVGGDVDAGDDAEQDRDKCEGNREQRQAR